MTSEQTEIVGLNKLKESDWNKALDCLTDAFSEDPCFLYLLQSEKYEPEKARFIHDYTLKYGFKTMEIGLLPGTNTEHFAMLREAK